MPSASAQTATSIPVGIPKAGADSKVRHLLLPALLLTALATLAPAPVHRSARTHRATPTHATAPTAGKQLAYYYASGNAVKYHSSSTYRGLNRCAASVQPLALSEAQ